MTADTLRDRLAAVLGPGNDDQTAYAQADAVLDILGEHTPVATALQIHARMRERVVANSGRSLEDEMNAVERWSTFFPEEDS